MRLAVIGAGIAGRSHLLDAVTNPRFDVVAVAACHLDRARAAAADFGLPAVYDSLPQLLRDTTPEAVVVATPPAGTPSILSEVLAYGCPMLVDKPGAATALDLAGVDPRARIVVGYNRRYQTHVQHCRDLLAGSALHRVRCRWTGPFADRYRSTDTYRHTAGWGHGVLLDTASHILDTLIFLGCAPIAIHAARLASAAGTAADVEADLHLDLGHQAAGLVAIRDSDTSTGDSWRIDITADRGQLVFTGESLSGRWEDEPLSITARDLRRPVDDLLAVADGAPTLGAPLSEAIDVLRLVDAAREQAGPHRRTWRRPRAKALGRLNGAC